MYRKAIWLPLISVAIIFSASRLYLKIVPDPIKENFGRRPFPYPGFLVLPADAVPPGFKEANHYYSKQQYSITFVKLEKDKNIRLSVSESDAVYIFKDKNRIKEFTYAGIVGHIYKYFNEKTLTKSLTLIWLNPPKQRVIIDVTQPLGEIDVTQLSEEFTPEDLIELLSKMK